MEEAEEDEDVEAEATSEDIKNDNPRLSVHLHHPRAIFIIITNLIN